MRQCLRFVSPFDVVAGNKKAHAGGTILVFSNTSAFYSRFVDDFNAQTIAGVKTFSSIPVLPASDPTTSNQAVRKAYADLKVALAGTEAITGQKTFPDDDTNRARITTDTDTAVATAFVTLGQLSRQAISGAADASTTVKGIVEEATQAEIIAGTAAGATGAQLFINPTAVAETGTDKIIKTKSTGLLDHTIIPNLKFGGTGADGALTISSGTTNIDLGSAAIFVKNYSSISITGTGALTFTNPHANGTIIIFKNTGATTLTSSATPNIDLRNLGSTPGAGYVSGTYISGDGGRGAGALYIESVGALNFTGTINASGTNGVAYSGASTVVRGGGGGGGASSVIILANSITANSGTVSTTAGAAGASLTSGGAPGAGLWGTVGTDSYANLGKLGGGTNGNSSENPTTTALRFFTTTIVGKYLFLAPGAGGGGGGGSNGYIEGGVGTGASLSAGAGYSLVTTNTDFV